MSVRAKIASHYKLRILAGALFLLGFAGWCFNDGYIAYPRERVIAREYAKFKTEGRTAEWNDYATTKNWPHDTYGEPAKDRSDKNIWFQIILGYAVALVGVICLVTYFRTLKRWVEWDGTRVNTSDGQSVAIESITKLDKSRWKKCFTLIQYSEPPGRLLLDAWKFEQAAIDKIVAEVESRVKPELVVQPPADTASTNTTKPA